MARWKIGLEDMFFDAKIGWYEQEQIEGNRFLVSVLIEVELSEFRDEERLEKTINYEEIYTIVQEEMLINRRLIETTCQAIADRLRQKFSQILSGSVVIKKLNPPLNAKVGASYVELVF